MAAAVKVDEVVLDTPAGLALFDGRWRRWSQVAQSMTRSGAGFSRLFTVTFADGFEPTAVEAPTVVEASPEFIATVWDVVVGLDA